MAIARVSARTHARTRTHLQTLLGRTGQYVYILAYHAIRSANIMRATRRVITLFRYTIDLYNCTASVLSLRFSVSLSLSFSLLLASEQPFFLYVSINIAVYDDRTVYAYTRLDARTHAVVVNLGSL